MKKISVMFVCHGNICRSPMAEFMFKNLVTKKGVADKFVISSSATSDEEIFCGVGNPMYPPAKRELLKREIPFSERRAVQLKKSDYDLYDYFLVMDEQNYNNAIKIFGGDKNKKVKKLLSFAGDNRDVADPWYSGDFSSCYNDIDKGINAFFNTLN